MGRREVCVCCMQMVTKAELKRHTEEVARKQNPTAMDGTPDTLGFIPITWNDIFPSRVSGPAPVPVPPVDKGTTRSNTSVGPPPSVAGPPLSLSPPQNPPTVPQGHQKREPVYRFVSGYVISRETAVRLGLVIQGIQNDPSTPIPADTYCALSFLEGAIWGDLFPKGQQYGVVVNFVGGTPPYETIFATQGCTQFNGPLPYFVEGETEKAVREWFESKGVRPDEYRWEIAIE